MLNALTSLAARVRSRRSSAASVNQLPFRNVALRLSSITQHPRPRNVAPSAREIFPRLRDHMLASRPIVGHTVETFHADGTSSGGHPIFGKPTFRNVIENGRVQ